MNNEDSREAESSPPADDNAKGGSILIRQTKHTGPVASLSGQMAEAFKHWGLGESTGSPND